MEYMKDFNIFVGAKYGIFKGVAASQGHPTISKCIQSLDHLSKDTDITALSWGDKNEEEILIGLSNQTVKLYDTNYKLFNSSRDARIPASDLLVPDEKCNQGVICGLSKYDEAMITAVESGYVRLWRYEKTKGVIINTEGPLSRMRHSDWQSSIIGTGGKENDLKLWDIATGKNTFTAKNVPNDSLQLRVPVWISDLAFMPNTDKVAVGSRYGYVRLYDPKAQRRPVIKMNLPDKAVTCITPARDNTVICGLAKGNLVTVDLRVGKPSKMYKGFVGAVRDVVCHPSEPYVVSVGLDRFLYVHHLDTKELLTKEYMTSQMNCVLIRSDFNFKSNDSQVAKKRGAKKATSENSVDECPEMDEIFDSLEKVEELQSKKRKLIEMSSSKKNLLLNPCATPQIIKVSSSEKDLMRNPCAAPQKSPAKKAEKSSALKSKNSQKGSSQSLNPFPKISNSMNFSAEQNENDDDIMIVSERLAPSSLDFPSEQDGMSDSEADEAEGDSSEIQEEDSLS